MCKTFVEDNMSLLMENQNKEQETERKHTICYFAGFPDILLLLPRYTNKNFERKINM